MFAFLSLLAASTAFPAPKALHCYSFGAFDAGYDLVVSASQRTALLRGITIAGPRELAHLVCRSLRIHAPRPDESQNYLVCSGPAQSEGFLVARVYTPGFAGIE